MAREPDDDALSWGDDADPTYLDSPAVERTSEKSPARSEVDVDDAGAATSTTPSSSLAERRRESARAAADATDEPHGMSSLMLLTLGILAGVYLLYTFAWFTSARATIAIPVGEFAAAMARIREYLSVAAPALWFATTVLLTRGRKSSLRLQLLVLGAIVLLPVPFIWIA
jgi:hypothetical protein